MKGRRFWKKTILYICPRCGTGEEYTYRVYNEPAPRYDEIPTEISFCYDWCEDMDEIEEEFKVITTRTNGLDKNQEKK